MLTKGHGKVGIKAAAGVYVDGKRENICSRVESVAEEVTERSFDAGRVFAIPENTKYLVTVAAGVEGEPHVLDIPGAVDVHDGSGLTGWKSDAGANLPLRPQLPCAFVGAVPFLTDFDDVRLRRVGNFGHPTSSFFTVDIFRGDQSRPRCAQTIEHAKPLPKSIKLRHR